MSKLKCWFAGSRSPFEFSFVDVVFAFSHQQAKHTVWKYGRQIQDECDGEYFDLRLTRMKEHDHMADGDMVYVVKDDETLHRLGWHEEGARQCATCEHHEWDGLMTVCDDCGQCNECGCDCEASDDE